MLKSKKKIIAVVLAFIPKIKVGLCIYMYIIIIYIIKSLDFWGLVDV